MTRLTVVSYSTAVSLWNMGCGSWTRAGRKCVYAYTKIKKSWSDARTFCQSMQGDLLKFDDQDDVVSMFS